MIYFEVDDLDRDLFDLSDVRTLRRASRLHAGGKRAHAACRKAGFAAAEYTQLKFSSSFSQNAGTGCS